ncbi:MAG: type III-A CRISPR-associated RAMP protein Csm5, partial [Deltaproteobacteria bacterium]|nr:type III-A CRISPR-associated RAMP protein Csm5 [Deltaproteobacteria bacterium]
MNKRFLTTVRVEGEFLSPVHIGSGQELDPFSCFMVEGYLYYFDLPSVLQTLGETERNAFLELANRDDLIGLRRFLSERLGRRKDVSRRILVSPSVEREFKAKIDDPRNQLVLQPFLRNQGTFNPVVPGSSIKGAIRTAVIDTLLEEKRLRLNEESLRDPKRMEKVVL